MSLRYTKKPVTIEAIRFVGLTELGDPVFDLIPNGGMIPDWLGNAIVGPEDNIGSLWVEYPRPIGSKEACPRLVVGTLEGKHIAADGDWLIRGVQGELYFCKPDIFEATYDVTPPDCPVLVALHDDGLEALGTVADSDGTDGH